jgi:cobalt/nickel transport system permease protein
MIIFSLALIFYAVLLNDVVKLLVLELFLITLMALARLEPGYVLKRLALIFPFGGFVALMQPFIRGGDIIYTWWVFELSRQGLDFGMILLAKLFVCVSAVILLSSVTTIPALLDGLKRLKVPKFFVTTLNMMVRYLYLFYENLHRIRTAQKCRGFSVRRNPQGYRFVLRNLGNTISTLFMKSYDQGEAVYTSMLARGYNANSDYILTDETKIKYSDLIIFILLGTVIIFLELSTFSTNILF